MTEQVPPGSFAIELGRLSTRWVVAGGLLSILTGEYSRRDVFISLFLVATIALMAAGRVFGPLTVLSIGEHLDNMLGYVATLMASAAAAIREK